MLGGPNNAMPGLAALGPQLDALLNPPPRNCLLIKDNNGQLNYFPSLTPSYLLRSGTGGGIGAGFTWTLPPASGADNYVQVAQSGLLAGASNLQHNLSTSITSVANPSGDFGNVGGVISQYTGGGGHPYVYTGSGSEEVMLTENYQGGTITNEGCSTVGRYRGMWRSRDGISTQRVRVYITDFSSTYLVYDSGPWTVNGVGTSGDMNGVVIAGALCPGFDIEVDVMNYDVSQGYECVSTKFIQADPAVFPENTVTVLTPFFAYYNPWQLYITGEGQNSEELVMWKGKSKFEQHGSIII